MLTFPRGRLGLNTGMLDVRHFALRTTPPRTAPLPPPPPTPAFERHCHILLPFTATTSNINSLVEQQQLKLPLRSRNRKGSCFCHTTLPVPLIPNDMLALCLPVSLDIFCPMPITERAALLFNALPRTARACHLSPTYFLRGKAFVWRDMPIRWAPAEWCVRAGVTSPFAAATRHHLQQRLHAPQHLPAPLSAAGLLGTAVWTQVSATGRHGTISTLPVPYMNKPPIQYHQRAPRTRARALRTMTPTNACPFCLLCGPPQTYRISFQLSWFQPSPPRPPA